MKCKYLGACVGVCVCVCYCYNNKKGKVQFSGWTKCYRA